MAAARMAGRLVVEVEASRRAARQSPLDLQELLVQVGAHRAAPLGVVAVAGCLVADLHPLGVGVEGGLHLEYLAPALVGACRVPLA
jgi:hypothetical protein